MNAGSLSSEYPKNKPTSYAAHTASDHAAEPGNQHAAEDRAGISGDENPERHIKKRDNDEVSISGHSRDRSNYPGELKRTEASLPYRLNKIRTPDAGLASWYRTALSLQDTPEQSKNRINIYV